MNIEQAINEALGEALHTDADLAEQAAAVDLASAWNKVAPPHLQKTPAELLAITDVTAQEIADKLGLDAHAVEEFMASGSDHIEIPPTATHGFDDTFGRPATD